MPRYLAVYIDAGNNKNGNPRRGWYVHDTYRPDGSALTDAYKGVVFLDEGYRGWRVLSDYVCDKHFADHGERLPALSLVYETGRIDVTPGEYRAALKLGREK